MWVLRLLKEDGTNFFFCGFDYDGVPEYTSDVKNSFVYKFGSRRTAIAWAFRNSLRCVEAVKLS